MAMSDFFSSLIEILMPFLAAFIFAYMLEPLTKRLVQIKVPRSLAALIALLVGIFASIVILLLLLNLLQHEIPLLKAQFPIWLKSLQEWLEPTLAKFNVKLDWGAIREMVQTQITSQITDNANALVTQSIGTIIKSSSSVLGFFANTVLVLFVLFYLLLEWDAFLNMVAELIPVRFRETFFKLAKEVDVLLSHYLRGQVLLMIVLACFYSLGLLFIGVKSAIPLGMFTGLVAFIPYVGFLISFILSALATLLQFGPGNALIAVLVLYGVGQLLEGFVLTPRLVGERIGLHPVAVLFSLMVFGQLFGFFGILLAFPMSAICLVTLRHFKHKLLTSQWFNSNT
jgi:predicted PurR-regulated permease PerM